jgi:hypothetical protein
MTRRASRIDHRRNQLDMRLISSRTVSCPDSRSLASRQGREALFRAGDDRFVLYLAEGDRSSAGEERVIFLELREAPIWLNEPSGQRGSFWT